MNLYTENEDPDMNCDTQLGSILSRNNFENTWPQPRATAEKLSVQAPLKKAGILPRRDC